MTFPAEAADEEGLFARLQRSNDPGEVRHGILALGDLLGLHAAGVIRAAHGPLQNVLCMVILRGGALLYPGFARAFPQADFCMLGMRRAPDHGSVDVEYMTAVPRDTYQATIYIDCISATGGTLLAARRLVTGKCDTGHEMAAVISSAAMATGRLQTAGLGLLGFSLYEELNGQVVTPDMGELDAGDLFSGVTSDEPATGPQGER